MIKILDKDGKLIAQSAEYSIERDFTGERTFDNSPKEYTPQDIIVHLLGEEEK